MLFLSLTRARYLSFRLPFFPLAITRWLIYELQGLSSVPGLIFELVVVFCCLFAIGPTGSTLRNGLGIQIGNTGFPSISTISSLILLLSLHLSLFCSFSFSPCFFVFCFFFLLKPSISWQKNFIVVFCCARLTLCHVHFFLFHYFESFRTDALLNFI